MFNNDTAKELLKKTVEKIEGAYAPATIRAYKSNFENFINIARKSNKMPYPQILKQSSPLSDKHQMDT